MSIFSKKTCEKKKLRNKRDIFNFVGAKPTAINLEHLTHIEIEGKRIIFHFYHTNIFIDLENEEGAKNCFEQILNVWAAQEESSTYP